MLSIFNRSSSNFSTIVDQSLSLKLKVTEVESDFLIFQVGKIRPTCFRLVKGLALFVL